MVQIGNYCHELQELDISDLGDISGDGIIALLVSTGNLKCLDLSCTKTDDKVFEILVKRVVKLEKLGKLSESLFNNIAKEVGPI